MNSTSGMNLNLFNTYFKAQSAQAAAKTASAAKSGKGKEEVSFRDALAQRQAAAQKTEVLCADLSKPAKTGGVNLAETVEGLTAEQLDELRAMYDPYEQTDTMGILGPNGQLHNLLGTLKDMGVLSEEEAKLVPLSTISSMRSWQMESSGLVAHRAQGALIHYKGDFNFEKADTASTMQWLEGMTLIDKNNPINSETTAARQKAYGLLLEVFGKPAEGQTVQDYLDNRGNYTVEII